MIRDRDRHNALLDRVRQWVRDTAIPAESAVAEADHIDANLVQSMKDEGFFGWSIPDEYGGSGMTAEELVTGAIELSQCSTAFRARVGTNTGIGSEALVVDGTPAQKARYLPALAAGDKTGCFALTEVEAGSEATNLQTTAVRDGESWVLNGSKRFITNAPIADLFTVFARTDPSTKGSKGISAFLVDASVDGIKAGPAYRKMGQAGSPVSDVLIENCRIPADALLGGREGVGFQTTMKVLNKQRLHLAALCIGPAIRMLSEAMTYATNRSQFGQPVAQHQLVQGMIADCQTEIAAARALVLETARKRDRGEDTRLDASMCKYFASEMCGRVADRAVQIFGGSGYVADFSSIERFYRDVRLFRLYEGTSQIHQLNIAKLTLAGHAA
nr:acyl-CoA dehydrogenase family protein [Amylibacter sp.]